MALELKIEERPSDTDDPSWVWWVEDEEGKWIASSPQGGFATRPEALTSFFTILFGTYNGDQFMDAYAEWQASLPKGERIHTGLQPSHQVK